MLMQLEKLSLLVMMEKIVPAIDGKDYKTFKVHAHSLKGSSGYVGASKVHYACYYIQEHHYHERFEEMIKYYPLLVEAAIEFRIYSR